VRTKRWLAMMLPILLCAALAGCRDGLNTEQIFKTVLENKDLLERSVTEMAALDESVIGVELQGEEVVVCVSDDTMPDGVDYRPTENTVLREMLGIPGIRDVTIFDQLIEFNCGGEGFGPETSYYGFYYTKQDAPVSALYPDLQPKGKGWIYEEEDSDNTYYTEKIADHWYYYEEHY